MKRFWAVAVCVLAACTAPPKLQPPDRIDSFCEGGAPGGAVIAGILGSVSDRVETSEAYPDAEQLRVDVQNNSGVIAHWNSQPLYMPFSAHTLGVAGNYIEITDVVIDNQLAGDFSRLLYVTVTTAQGPKKVVLRALDTQNVCVPGQSL